MTERKTTQRIKVMCSVDGGEDTTFKLTIKGAFVPEGVAAHFMDELSDKLSELLCIAIDQANEGQNN